MASSSDYTMSSPLSLWPSSPSQAPSPSRHSTAHHQQQHQQHHHIHHNHNYNHRHNHNHHHNQQHFSPPPRQPPRLPSPHLFRNFFASDMAGPGSHRRHHHLPTANPPANPPANFQESMQHVSRAIHSASRALQNAQEAFQSTSSYTQTHPHHTDTDVVDLTLTDSPPDESAFMSRTHHPHDSGRRTSSIHVNANSLNQPVYGAHATHTRPRPRYSPELQLPSEPANSLARARNRHVVAEALTGLPALPPPPLRHYRNMSEVDTRYQDEQAIRRQRDARAQWNRTQKQSAQRQQHRPHPSSSPPSQPNPHPASRPPSSPSSVEAVDLTGVETNTDLAAALSKQRQDAIAMQNSSSQDSGRTPLTAYKCPICMETPRNATTTVCGHLFCHRCIMDTLKWSEDQRRDDALPGRKPKGVCPVCRKELARKDDSGPARALVPLELKLVTRKRKRDDKGKGKGVDRTVEDIDELVDGGKENAGNGKAKVSKWEPTEDEVWEQFTTV